MKFTLLGCGVLGGAILDALVTNKVYKPEETIMVEQYPNPNTAKFKEMGFFPFSNLIFFFFFFQRLHPFNVNQRAKGTPGAHPCRSQALASQRSTHRSKKIRNL